MADADAWLRGKQNVRRLDSNRAEFGAASLPSATEIVVFRPSPELRRWTPEFTKAYALMRGSHDERLDALQLDRRFIGVWLRAAETIAQKSPPDAARLMEEGLAVTWPDDYEWTARARRFLARLYRELGRESEAANQERAARALSHEAPTRK